MAATLTFAGNIGPLVNAMKQAEREVQGFGSAADKAFLAAGAAMAGLVTQAFRLAIPLDASIRQFQNIGGLTATQTEAMKEGILDVSVATGIAAEEILDGAEALAAYGYEGQQALAVLEKVGNLTNAFGGDFSELNAALVKTSAQWDVSIDTISLFAVAAQKVTGVAMPQLIQELGEVSVSMKAAGFEFADTLGIFAGLTRQFKDPGQATSVAAALAEELANAEGSFNLAIQDAFGQSFTDLTAEVGGVGEAFRQLEERFGGEGLTNLFQSETVKRAVRGVLEELDTISQVTGANMRELAQVTETAVANSAGSMEEQINSLTRAWEAFLVKLVDVSEDSPLHELVGELTELLTNDNVIGAFQAVAEAMVGVISPMTLLAEALGLLSNLEIGDTSALDVMMMTFFGAGIIRKGNQLGAKVAGGGVAASTQKATRMAGARGLGRTAAGAAIPVIGQILVADMIAEHFLGKSVVMEMAPEGIAEAGKDLVGAAQQTATAVMREVDERLTGGSGSVISPLGSTRDGRSLTAEEIARYNSRQIDDAIRDVQRRSGITPGDLYQLGVPRHLMNTPQEILEQLLIAEENQKKEEEEMATQRFTSQLTTQEETNLGIAHLQRQNETMLPVLETIAENTGTAADSAQETAENTRPTTDGWGSRFGSLSSPYNRTLSP